MWIYISLGQPIGPARARATSQPHAVQSLSSSHRTCLLNSFRKAILTQNRQLIVYYYESKC